MSAAMTSEEPMRPAAKAFVGLITVAGLSVLGAAAMQWTTDQPVRFLAFLVMAMLASTLKVYLPGVPGTMSVNFLFILIGVLELSLPETLAMGCAAGALQLTWKSKVRPDPVKIVFNVCSMAVAIAAAWTVHHAPWLIDLGASEIIRLAAAASVYFVMNTVPVALVISLTSSSSIWGIWRDCYFWSFPYYLIGAAVAGLLSLSNRYLDWQTTVLVLPVIYFFYRSYRSYLDRLEAEKTHAAELTGRTELLEAEMRERKRAEEILRESEERYRTLFESSPHPMWVYDQETLEFIEVNHSAVQHYGFARAEFLAMRAGDLCDESEPEARMPKVSGETTHRKKDGSTFPVELRSHELTFSGRKAVLVLADDITQRRLAEELRIQKDAAVEANRAKSEFLANMSHELRTPLNAVIGYSHLLVEDAANGPAAEFVPDLKKIQNSGKHLLGLINDILDLSKIEAGRMPLYLEEFDVEGMVEHVVTTVQPLVERGRNTLTVDCDPDLGLMRADMTKTKQILFNLLSNATKFTEDGSIRFEARLQRRWDRAVVAFRVQDTGVGMTPAQMQKVGEPFTQADASTTRRYGGTGLGLTISNQYCQMMGGEIVVESELAKGSTFTAFLPLQVSETDAEVERADMADTDAA